MTLASTVTSGQLRKAASIKAKIEKLQEQINNLFGYVSGYRNGAKPPTTRVMSPEAKQRIIAAQKKRWAAFRKAKKKSRK